MNTAANNTEHIHLDTAAALARTASVQRDPVRMARAIEEINRMREELRQRIGTVNVAVDLVHEFRDQ